VAEWRAVHAGGSIHQNLIVSALPDAERFHVAGLMEPVDMPVRAEAVRGGAANSAVYFPTSGLISVVTAMADGSAVECAAVGVEGWIGAEVFASSMPAGTVAFQQIAGSALRLSGESFAAVLRDAPVFAAAVSRYAGVLLAQTMQTAACNRLHDAIARCARWLLFTSERIGSVELAITHEFLAQMLGASRSAVTVTLMRLEQQELIERQRAHIVIRDVEGLRRAACECHDVLADSYSRYLSTLR
jgi:CRP-like cAMP-binding protein